MTGVSVAVLALDGVDKKPVVSRLTEALRGNGLDSKRISWQRYLAKSGADPGDPGTDLDALWVDVFRVFFGGATADGRAPELPASFRDSAEKDILAGLRDTRVQGMRPASPLATAWIELAAHTMLHHGVVRPLLAKGLVVVQESLGVKNLIKSLHMAEYLDPAHGPAFAGMREFVKQHFGSSFAPDVGVFLDDDPADLLARDGGRQIGALDSFELFGGEREETFLRLQTACRADFGDFARTHGWLTIRCGDVTPGSVDELVQRVLAAAAVPD